jgi:hypothetical protein
MSAPAVSIRFLEQDELESALECERCARVEEDPEFGQVVPRWAWDEQKFLKFIREDEGVKTRIVIAEVLRGAEAGKFREGDRPSVCGVMAYELHKASYHVVLFTSSFEVDVKKSFLDWLVRKAEHNERTELSFEVPDGDWQTIKFLQDQGFSVRLVSDLAAAGWDVWLCEKKLAVPKKETAKK